MSDRMSLWPKHQPKSTFDVQLADHPTLREAIKAFANWQQSLNVYGPREKIEEARALWEEMEYEDELPPAETVTWVIQEKPFEF